MFERRCGRTAAELRCLTDELPAVQRIEQIHVTRCAVEYLERHGAVGAKLRGRLIGIHAVAEREAVGYGKIPRFSMARATRSTPTMNAASRGVQSYTFAFASTSSIARRM